MKKIKVNVSLPIIKEIKINIHLPINIPSTIVVLNIAPVNNEHCQLKTHPLKKLTHKCLRQIGYKKISNSK